MLRKKAILFKLYNREMDLVKEVREAFPEELLCQMRSEG